MIFYTYCYPQGIAKSTYRRVVVLRKKPSLFLKRKKKGGKKGKRSFGNPPPSFFFFFKKKKERELLLHIREIKKRFFSLLVDEKEREGGKFFPFPSLQSTNKISFFISFPFFKEKNG